MVYLLDGSVKINQQVISGKQLIHFNNDGTKIAVKCLENARFILLSGAPINEEVTSYGPFVMNTEDEIRQAIVDYQSGKMGILEEKFE